MQIISRQEKFDTKLTEIFLELTYLLTSTFDDNKIVNDLSTLFKSTYTRKFMLSNTNPQYVDVFNIIINLTNTNRQRNESEYV